MYLYCLKLGMIVFATFMSCSAAAVSDPLNDLQKRLESLDYISYVYQREGNYTSDGHFHQYKGEVFFDFTNKMSSIGANCYFESSEYIAVYNGTELFHCDKRTKEIQVGVNLTPEEIDSEIFLPCSILSIKNALPWVMEDKEIYKRYRDTLVNGRKTLMIRLEFKKRTISGIGKPWNISKRENLYYSIFVDSENGLPFQILMQNGDNSDYFKATFTNIIDNNNLKTPETFYYSNYLKYFKLSQKKNSEKLILPGTRAPDFTLLSHNTKEKVDLNSIKTPFTLIVFAIVNCGYSQEMIPRLNKIYNSKFQDKFTVLIINPYDSENLIDKFINITQPQRSFRILLEGKSVAKQYGINGYPTTVLLDKEKNVMFISPGFDETKILSLIK